jgi:hypothetical protein
MDRRQAAAFKTVLEAAHPDAETLVAPRPNGADVTIDGTMEAPSLSGPGGLGRLTMSLSDDSPFLALLMLRHAPSAVPDL